MDARGITSAHKKLRRIEIRDDLLRILGAADVMISKSEIRRHLGYDICESTLGVHLFRLINDGLVIGERRGLYSFYISAHLVPTWQALDEAMRQFKIHRWTTAMLQEEECNSEA